MYFEMMNPYNEDTNRNGWRLYKIEDTIYYYLVDLSHPFGWIYWLKILLGVCAAAKQKLKPQTLHLPRHAHHIFANSRCQLPSNNIFYRLKKVNI